MKLAGALVALVIGGAVVGLAISGLYKPAAPPPAPAPIAKVEPPPPPPPAPPPPAPVIPPAPPPVVAAPPPRPAPGPGEPPLPRAVPHEQVTITALPPPTGFTPQPPPAEAPVAPPVAPGPPGTPAWQRYAVASPPAAGRPMIAIVIDDMGVDRRRSETMLRLPAPLTMSYMSYAVGVSRDAAEAHAHGDELMEHVPMEPIARDVDPGPGALLQNLPPAELQRRIDQALSAFTGYVGINNHEGSKFTAYGPGMSLVLAELKRRGLLFVDSRTSAKTVGLTMAREMGVPAAGRDVFLDDVPELDPVRRQLAATEAYARKHGSVIAIGHPKDATYEALAAWLPTLAAKGFQLVPVSAVVRARMGLKPAQATVVRNSRP